MTAFHRKMIDNFLGVPTVPGAVGPNNYMGTKLAEADDPEDPIQPSEDFNPAVADPENSDPGPGEHGMINMHGLRDFLTHVVEELEDWVERETEHGVGHQFPRKHDKPTVIDVRPRPSASWRGVTYNVDRELQIVVARDDRLRVIITNYGPGDLYVSHDTQSLGTNPAPNVIRIPAPGAAGANTGQRCWREFYTKKDIWAFPAVVGTAQAVDVQDEYGE
jgi:hypothetical protein